MKACFCADVDLPSLAPQRLSASSPYLTTDKKEQGGICAGKTSNLERKTPPRQALDSSPHYPHDRDSKPPPRMTPNAPRRQPPSHKITPTTPHPHHLLLLPLHPPPLSPPPLPPPPPPPPPLIHNPHLISIIVPVQITHRTVPTQPGSCSVYHCRRRRRRCHCWGENGAGVQEVGAVGEAHAQGAGDGDAGPGVGAGCWGEVDCLANCVGW